MRTTDIKGSRPPQKLLEGFAPWDAWRSAIRQAERSTNRRHRTGAVLMTRQGAVCAKGTAHDSNLSGSLGSIHAERHALVNLHPFIDPHDCLIVTLTRSNNFAKISKPCSSCAVLLKEFEVRNVIYAEWANDGTWTVQKIPVDLLTNCVTPKLAN